MRSIVILFVGIFVGVGVGVAGTVLWEFPQARASAIPPTPSSSPIVTTRRSTIDELSDPSAPQRFHYLLGGAEGTLDRCGVPDKFASDFELGRSYRETSHPDSR